MTSLILLARCVIYILSILLFFLLYSQCITKLPTKLMMTKYIEGIDYIYNSTENNCDGVILGMGINNKGKHFLNHNTVVRQGT